MTLILENTDQVKSHTNIYEIIEPFEKEFSELNWLLTNQEYEIFDFEENGEVPKLNFDDDRITFKGTELLECVKHRDIDFIWCVLCGFRGKIPELKNSDLPYVDLNSEIWNKPNMFFNENSEIEIKAQVSIFRYLVDTDEQDK